MARISLIPINDTLVIDIYTKKTVQSCCKHAAIMLKLELYLRWPIITDIEMPGLITKGIATP